MSKIHRLARDMFPQILQVLRSEGYRCIGPQIRDGAILYDNLDSIEQLPRGWQDRQAPGEYRISENDSPRYFAWANGPQALKPRLFTAREVLWKATIDANKEISFSETELADQPLAVIA